MVTSLPEDGEQEYSISSCETAAILFFHHGDNFGVNQINIFRSQYKKERIGMCALAVPTWACQRIHCTSRLHTMRQNAINSNAVIYMVKEILAYTLVAIIVIYYY